MGLGISGNNTKEGKDLIETPSNYSIIRIEFMESKSKRFQSAVNLIRGLPNYEHNELDKKHSFKVSEIKDYAIYYLEIEELISIISKWKSAVIILYGKNHSNNLFQM